MTRKFDFHTDAGHGWLKVHVQDLADIALTVEDFTPYSYRAGAWLYLEEDLDAGTFIREWEAKRGEFSCREIDDGYQSSIRNLDQLPAGASFDDITL